jgi:hypothetical protein
MKRIIFWVLPLVLLFSACQKDIGGKDEASPDQLKFGRIDDGVKTPLKANFYAMPNMDVPPIQCMPAQANVMLPGAMFVGGSATHIGEVQMMNSPFINTACYFNEMGQLVMEGNGTITAANGDKYYYTSTTYTNLSDFTFTGVVIMNGGTGRFVDCTGECVMTGRQNANGIGASWTAEGWMITKK